MRRVELVDVRSYATADLELGSGVTVLVGANGHGKTNLVEAIHRAATGRSHRVSGDQPLVRVGAEQGVVRLEIVTDEGRHRRIELELGRVGHRPRTRVDGQDVRRASAALGVVRVVLFAPEDTAIVRGDPGDRRRFLDDLLAQRRPAFAAARSEYERVLRQRNNLLKQLRGMPSGGRDAAAATIDTWTEQLIAHAATLTAARLAAMHALAGPVARIYDEVAAAASPTAPTVHLAYRSSTGAVVDGDPDKGVPERGPLEDALREAAAAAAAAERQRGVTLVGPHRDDLELSIDGMPARTHASQGEVWSLALSLKLATYEVLSEVGDRPVVVLDDVFSELDATRRAHLAAACDGWEQVIVTAAVDDDVPLAGRRVDVTRTARGSALRSRT